MESYRRGACYYLHVLPVWMFCSHRRRWPHLSTIKKPAIPLQRTAWRVKEKEREREDDDDVLDIFQSGARKSVWGQEERKKRGKVVKVIYVSYMVVSYLNISTSLTNYACLQAYLFFRDLSNLSEADITKCMHKWKKGVDEGILGRGRTGESDSTNTTIGLL